MSLRKIAFICLLSGVCFSISTGLPLPHAATSRDIHIGANPPFFSPNQITISLGTPLTWKNRTREPHTIVSDDCRRGSTCSFESSFLRPNAHYTLPRLSPGRYPYHCGLHPYMRGILTIYPPQSFSSSDI